MNDLASPPAPPATPASATPPSSLRRLVRLAQKELRETLRDRRTIVTLVLMPILVYPLLSLAFRQYLLSNYRSGGDIAWVGGVASDADLQMLAVLLERGDPLVRAQEGEPLDPAASDGLRPKRQSSPLLRQIRWQTGGDLSRKLRAGELDLVVRFPQDNDAPPPVSLDQLAARVELLYRDDSAVGREAMEFVRRRLEAVNAVVLEQRLRQLGDERPPPARVSLEAVQGEATGGAVSLATLAPLILILMTITGAVYPAIDLTAGERERGTLEALMAAPAPRLALLIAKFIAVLTVALLTAAANLTAMTVTLASSGLGTTLFGPQGLSLAAVGQVLLLLALFAAFFSAVLLAVTSFARSFKEAQAYLIPLMLIAMAPGFLSVAPGLRLTAAWAVTPLANIVLLARDALQGTTDPVLAGVAVLSTALYAAAALAVAARIFGSDAILYGSQETWQDLLRRPAEPQAAPTAGSAAFCLALIFPLYFLLAGQLALWQDASLAGRLLAAALVTAALFAGLPALVAWSRRVPWRGAFQLRGASSLVFAGAAALGLSLWPFAHELFLLGRQWGLATLDESRFQGMEELLGQWRTLSPALLLATLGVVPGVCEELFFRGYFLAGLRTSARASLAILLSGLLFGVFHVFVGTLLATERLLPSAALGLILAWIAWRSRSVLPGMLLHVTHNCLLLLIAYYRNELLARGWGLGEQEHLPGAWLAAAAAVAGLGLALVAAGVRGRRDPLPSPPSP